jgi:hypothetical protein
MFTHRRAVGHNAGSKSGREGSHTERGREDQEMREGVAIKVDVLYQATGSPHECALFTVING